MVLFFTCIRAHFTVRQIYVCCTSKLSEDLSSYHTLCDVSGFHSLTVCWLDYYELKMLFTHHFYLTKQSHYCIAASLCRALC